MIDALGITGNLGADDTSGVGIGAGAAHPADPALLRQIDLQRAGGGTVMRTDSVAVRVFLI